MLVGFSPLPLKLPCPFGFWKHLLIIQSKSYQYIVHLKSQSFRVLLPSFLMDVRVTLFLHLDGVLLKNVHSSWISR